MYSHASFYENQFDLRSNKILKSDLEGNSLVSLYNVKLRKIFKIIFKEEYISSIKQIIQSSSVSNKVFKLLYVYLNFM